jgi:hypothetical protein
MAMNPTINFQVGDLMNLPVPLGSSHLVDAIPQVIRAVRRQVKVDETTFDFVAPLRWNTGLDELAATQTSQATLEAQIDDEIYRLYDLSAEDRAAIEAEVASGSVAEQEEGEASLTNGDEAEEPQTSMTREELAVRWISYAMGIVSGRFRPSIAGALGLAVYRRADFAIGSLPEPDEAEFDQLVGPPERFAYVDAEGGRHLFPAQAEAALRALAVPDGITVLDPGHPHDLPRLVEKALSLMLGEQPACEVIAEGAGGDLRGFMSRDYFTRWHLRWYRKRPVYWPLQSARRSYGFVLFHERVDRMTLYTLQRDYLDHKLNGLRLQIGDLTPQLEGKAGRERKGAERQIDQARQLLEELTAFAATMERIVREGYEPGPDWIDDGVILRLAPLWEMMPLWKSEPKKYWERLQQGDFDWSHIAMRYWPERVREECETNKSFAIAHGHDEWYQDG